MKNVLIAGFCIWVVTLIGCGEVTITEVADPTIQRAEDVAIIESYLIGKGYTLDQIDTTRTGVRYVVLDSGQTQFDSLLIEEGDFIEVDFIGKVTSDTLFDTSIRSIAEANDIVNESIDYVPFKVTWSSSGWSFSNLFIPGFVDGLGASFKDLHIGCHTLIVMPSDLGYGPLGNGDIIPPNSVIAFELFAVGIEKP